MKQRQIERQPPNMTNKLTPICHVSKFTYRVISESPLPSVLRPQPSPPQIRQLEAGEKGTPVKFDRGCWNDDSAACTRRNMAQMGG